MAKSSDPLARTPEALLCFGYCGGHLLALQNSNVYQLVSKSALALSYYNGLGHLARNFQVSSLDIQQLMGFEPTQSSQSVDPQDNDRPPVSDFWLFSSSVIFDKAQEDFGTAELTPYTLGVSSVVVPGPDIHQLAIATILSKIRSEVRSMHIAGSNARCLQPCLDFAIFGKCNRINCGRHEVNSYKISIDDRQNHFNIRVRAHILLILIVDAYQAKNKFEEREHLNFRW